MHGLIFFYLHKFAVRFPVSSASSTSAGATILRQTHLPSGVYPDADAVAILAELAGSVGRPVSDVVGEFGEFLAPNLLKVAGSSIDPEWRTLDLIENTESVIHRMVRVNNPGATPPVLEVLRVSPDEAQVIYSSKRQLCTLALGLIRGIARHFNERIEVSEASCMLNGEPYCSFIVRRHLGETHSSRSPLEATLPSSSIASAGDRVDVVVDEPMPESIGGYRILSQIGSGAMGRVFLAHDDRLDRRVALKVMSARHAANPSARQRFVCESRAVAAIEHPHVMTIHQVGEYHGIPYIVMQLLDGRTLRDHRDAVGPMPLREVLRIGKEIAAGLAAAHRRGIIHRDIKPANVHLSGHSHSVRIIDFGLARQIDSTDVALTHDGDLIGTPSYMPPERIHLGEIEATGDLFGLGVILYELLANRLPFEGRTVAAVLAEIAKGTPTPLHEVAPNVPQEVCDFVMKLIATEKEDRPPDADSVAAALAALERSVAS